MSNVPNLSSNVPAAIAGLAEHVCRYFLEFLETDFKRKQAPRRKISNRSENGQLTCVSLRKYASFYKDVWKVTGQPISKGQTFSIKRQQHTARLSPILASLIKQYVAAIEDDPFCDAAKLALNEAKRGRGTGATQVEQYVDTVLETLGEALDKKVIVPLLTLMESTIKQQAYSAIDSIYEIETDLVNALMAQVSTVLPEALTSYLVTGDLDPVARVLADLLDPRECRQRLQDSLSEFATADLYQELRDLHDYQRTQEAGQLYLYLCDLKFRNNLYPLLYVPMNFEWDKEKGEFRLTLDPHLFVNKRALDFVLQELDRQLDRRVLSPIEDRIYYLREDGTLLAEVEKVVNKVQSRLDLDRQIDVRTASLQSGANATLKLSSACYLASFDKSDESVLNDYEELLHALSNDQAGLLSLFQSFVKGVVLDDPVQVIGKVDDAWDALSISDRLVPESPIPINEEQRKILVALDNDNCRFLVALGPPGTGKSHTITAIAFDCILKGKSVLILSDKKEALDVVEDKLVSTLKAVRGDDNFLNPLLRLGRTGQTYTKLLSQNATERIRQHNRAAKQNKDVLQKELDFNQQALKAGIKKTVDELSSVDLKEIEELHRIEGVIEGRLPGLTEHLQKPEVLTEAKNLLATIESALASPALNYSIVLTKQLKGLKQFHDAINCLKRQVVLSTFVQPEHNSKLASLALFRGLTPKDRSLIDQYVNEFIRLKSPFFGYLFKGKKLAELSFRIGQALRCTDIHELHKRISDLKSVSQVLGVIENTMGKISLPVEFASSIYDDLAAGHLPNENPLAVVHALGTAYSVVTNGCQGGLKLENFKDIDDFLVTMKSAARYASIWQDVNTRMESVPHIDAVSARTALEKLHAQRMAEQMDARFLNFIDTAHATAKALGGVIRSKQKFPTDSFDHLRNAFPCIIAGIREFAEYIPLRQDIFDVVIIDEASQVSVAQAFPALLRAKKVVVMGDPKQFSNVKSANASNELNQAWRSDMEHYFKENISDKADKLERLSRFDVKRSILDFFDLVSNFRIMLRKHFRGYQELISFSSRYFYSDGLQAIKVRGKPLDEVIVFTELTWDGRHEPYRNVNSMELQVLIEYLDDHLEEPVPPSIGIITPFREQQSLLTRELFKAKNGSRYEDELRLKIMTFDTCQGEERDIIYYSMVATPQTDRLNYVFPVDLENAGDRVDEALKMQRLNVGFSRAKEAIHFILSKPIDQYRGSIARALQHYANLLEAGEPDPGEVDPSSPMEAKVLDWLLKTQYYQANREDIEITPQFPVGDYLKQLDPFYQHPAYRVDFLLQHCTKVGMVNVIIEYDGFQEHFTDHGKIHVGNFSRYYRPEDVERQMVLESYGYKFLRINRFNLGRDPVTILSKRLYDLIGASNKEQAVESVKTIQAQAKGLADGTNKICQRCKQIKPLEEFYDKALKNGEGGYGRVCIGCKNADKSSSSGRGYSGYRRWKRRYWY